jgi:hypothetical protein
MGVMLVIKYTGIKSKQFLQPEDTNLKSSELNTFEAMGMKDIT